MPPPRFKVIDTPEEAAQALQHHPDKEKHCEILQLKSLKVTDTSETGGGSTEMSQSVTPELSALNGGGEIELDDWVECCATGAGFVAMGSADGEVLLLKSAAGEAEAVESARFLAHGDAGLNFEAATMDLCFAPAGQKDADGNERSLMVSSGEDGKLKVWSVEALLAGGAGDAALCCEVSGLDGKGADYRRRGRGAESERVPSMQLVACSPAASGQCKMGDLAVAVGRSLWLVALSSDWQSHTRSVQLGVIDSTATALEFAALPGMGVSLLAACYGAVSMWSEATLQAGAEAPPSRTLDYKGPLLGAIIYS